MKIDRKALVAIAVGWFVLVDILLRTTEGLVGFIVSMGSNVRGLAYAFFNIRGGDFFTSLIIGLIIIAISVIIILSLLLLVYLRRAWTSVINLTRFLVNFFFFNSDTETEGTITMEKNLLRTLFGENVLDLKSRDGLLWRTLFN